MTELDDLRKENAALRERIWTLTERVGEVEARLNSILSGAADSEVATTVSPVLLDAAQAALRRSDTLLRAVIEKSADAISLTSADGTTQYLTSLERILGWTAEDLATRAPRERVLPEDRVRLEAALEELVRTGARDMTIDLRVLHRDGSLRWIESSATNLLKDPDVGAIVANYRDITPRKKAEEALREERAPLPAPGRGPARAGDRSGRPKDRVRERGRGARLRSRRTRAARRTVGPRFRDRGDPRADRSTKAVAARGGETARARGALLRPRGQRARASRGGEVDCDRLRGGTGAPQHRARHHRASGGGARDRAGAPRGRPEPPPAPGPPRQVGRGRARSASA